MVGVNNEESVISVVTCMMMIRLYIPGCLGENTHFLPNFRFFAAFLPFLLNFRSFSNGQKARKPRSAILFIIITCKRRFFRQKKKPILGAKVGNRLAHRLLQCRFNYVYFSRTEANCAPI